MDFNFNSPERYSPLVLAYLGDAVFELYVRAVVVERANMPVDELNRQARRYVKAQAQAQMYHRLTDRLNDEELAVLRRGRNAKTYTSAKNASVNDYRHATGLEALFGYLFIKGDHARISQLFEMCMEESSYEEQ